MSIKALVMDCGGVLLRTKDWNRLRRWERQLGLIEDQLAPEIWSLPISRQALLGLATPDMVWREVGRHFRLSNYQIQEMRSDFFASEFLDGELIAFVSSINAKYQTCILSNAWLDARMKFTHAFKLNKVFDTIIISSEEGIAKPDMRLYHILAARLGVDFSEVLFIDDSLANIVAAQMVGINSILFQTSSHIIEVISSLLISNV